MPQRLRQLVRFITRREVILLLAALVVVTGTWGFIELADEVAEGTTQPFDEWALQALRNPDNPAIPIGPWWVPEVMRDITALGSTVVLAIITLAVVCFLLMRHKYRAMALVIIAVVGGSLLSSALKYLFNRPRPQAVEHLAVVGNPSFPSGHSMLAAVVYLTLGALLARLVTDWPSRIYLLLVALALAFLVGISRVFLGVHYPTDVFAGWTAGLVWAVLCWLVAQYLQRRGKIEQTIGSSADHPVPSRLDTPP